MVCAGTNLGGAALRRSGIGKSLIDEGLARLRGMDAAGCVLVGDPGYYQRFGFKPFPHLAPDGEPPEYFMILPMAVGKPTSEVGFHRAFYGG
jgi:putative acetyltransferase